MCNLDLLNYIANTLIAVTSFLSFCCSSISTVFIVLTFVYFYKEVNQSKLANYAASHIAIVDRLQREDVREARAHVFTDLKDKPLEIWDEHDRKLAGIVCHNYDTVGQMIRNQFLPKHYILASWGDSIRKSWPILKPMIELLRAERNAPETWDDFEWMAKQLEQKKY